VLRQQHLTKTLQVTLQSNDDTPQELTQLDEARILAVAGIIPVGEVDETLGEVDETLGEVDEMLGEMDRDSIIIEVAVA
jgi:hypothetical protein